LFIKGLSEPWKWRYVPDKVFKAADGSSSTQYQGFQRYIRLELAPISADDDFIRIFLQAETKTVLIPGSVLLSDSCQATFEEIEQEDAWHEDFFNARLYTIDLLEKTVRTDWPTPIPIGDNMTGFIVHDIEVVGTLSAPETFTTNVGKLLYQHDTFPFPPIDLSTNKVSIVFDYDQPWMVCRVGAISQSGTNITFQLAVAGSGEYAIGASVVKATFEIKLQSLI
jgi:hypothetical protein